jgi:hypothetical protein
MRMPRDLSRQSMPLYDAERCALIAFIDADDFHIFATFTYFRL